MEEKLYGEIDEFLSLSSDPDEGDLPFEPLDAFSTEPVEFGEMAENMLDKVENLFDLTRLYNRHSVKYLKTFALLEKGIRFLGSACVTKYAMGAHDYSFPELSQMTTQKLYRMASFNYRKLNTALTEKLQQKNDLYQEMTEAYFRCFNLLRRLRATERKINSWLNQKYFSEENFSEVVEGLAFSKKSWSKHYTSDREEAPAFRSAPAYPVIASQAVRSSSSKKNRKSEIRDTETPVIEKAQPVLKALPEPKALPQPAEAGGTDGSSATDTEPAKENETGKEKEETEMTKNQKDKYADLRKKYPAAARVLDGPRDVAKPVHGTPLITEPPPCIGIVQKAMRRGPADEIGGIAFTNSEILDLAADPFLEDIFPDMAPWVNKVAEKLRMQKPG